MSTIMASFAVVLVISLWAQQPKSEDELRADLDRALQERNGTRALVAMLAMNQYYQGHQNWSQQAEILKAIILYWSTHIEANSVGFARYTADLAEAHLRAGDTADAEKEIQRAISIFESSGPKYNAAKIRSKRILYAILKRENKVGEAVVVQGTLPTPPRQERWDKHPEVLSKGEPEYTKAARQKQVSGDVSLSLIVDETGNPKDIEVTAPLGFGLDENAVKSVKKWKFSPATFNGQPISIHATVDVSFRLLPPSGY